jgi:hypothetical protein
MKYLELHNHYKNVEDKIFLIVKFLHLFYQKMRQIKVKKILKLNHL